MRRCDREGIVAIDEAAAVGQFEGFSVDSASGMGVKSTWLKLDTKAQHEQDISELIARDKNPRRCRHVVADERAGVGRSGCARVL